MALCREDGTIRGACARTWIEHLRDDAQVDREHHVRVERSSFGLAKNVLRNQAIGLEERSRASGVRFLEERGELLRHLGVACCFVCTGGRRCSF